MSPTPARSPEPDPLVPRAPLALDPLPLPGALPEEPDRFAAFHPSVAGPSPAPSEEDALAAARLEAELASKLEEMPIAADSRFRTWRPSGAVVPDLAPIAPLPGEDRDRAPPEREAREPRAGRGPYTERRRGTASAEPAEDPLDEFFFSEGERGAGLEGLPVTAPPAAVAEPQAVLEEYLTFALGAETYGVAIGTVREVMRSPPVTEVPRAPADVTGVITVRGEVVAVFDPRRRLGLPPGQGGEAARVVIVEDGGGPCGLLVDAVSSVVRLPVGAVEPCPQGIGGASVDCLAGVGRDHERLFTVLDVAALLRPVRRAGEGKLA